MFEGFVVRQQSAIFIQICVTGLKISPVPKKLLWLNILSWRCTTSHNQNHCVSETLRSPSAQKGLTLYSANPLLFQLLEAHLRKDARDQCEEIYLQELSVNQFGVYVWSKPHNCWTKSILLLVNLHVKIAQNSEGFIPVFNSQHLATDKGIKLTSNFTYFIRL